MRTNIYIDGFNFYYRAVKNTPYKWSDLKALSSCLLAPHHKILAIKYFTAPVSGKADPSQPVRQMRYLNALKKHIPEFQYIFGKFQINKHRLPLVSNPNKKVAVFKPEEKGSDVNLAVHLLNDAWENRFDCAVIVSNDSDLAEAMRLTRKLGKKIGLFIPGKHNHSLVLKRHADFIKLITPSMLQKCQLPDPIPGTKIYKPQSW